MFCAVFPFSLQKIKVAQHIHVDLEVPDRILHVYVFWRSLISAPIKCHLFSYHYYKI